MTVLSDKIVYFDKSENTVSNSIQEEISYPLNQ